MYLFVGERAFQEKEYQVQNYPEAGGHLHSKNGKEDRVTNVERAGG